MERLRQGGESLQSAARMVGRLEQPVPVLRPPASYSYQLTPYTPTTHPQATIHPKLFSRTHPPSREFPTRPEGAITGLSTGSGGIRRVLRAQPRPKTSLGREG
ncbi:hypothetical protein PCANC_12591 [Puccinia coronata f. sp. avenae]|uniref:Uncharacterized protein n=1 Tax=Puccinia coronata f. sp. avenae TaxID=200324 RepID=A0A2N5UMX0_9BASI|nr:hypothetical protein PCANC_12591 [Puccinia coronata f. sp. avenae]